MRKRLGRGDERIKVQYVEENVIEEVFKFSRSVK